MTTREEVLLLLVALSLILAIGFALGVLMYPTLYRWSAGKDRSS